MFLRALSLKGFKSFAEPTVLELEPGVTVVVGPNGSGKSNLVDAMSWVLGAQGPSTVRSGKMDDVIFAGTSDRPALGRAEVGLTIDNSDGELPIDFTEVTFTRTLFRNGESEYAINGTPCRLLDITDLLSDSGIGRHQHVIVSQGNLEDVLKAKPVDRRLIIEEAAGVLKYRRRKEKAERRLASTEANLVRLTDLSREVRRQLRPLERQADSARRHGQVVTELRSIKTWLAGREIEAITARQANAVADREARKAEEAELRRRLTELDQAVEEAEGRLAVAGADAGGDDLARIEALRERARGLTAVLGERLRRIQRDRQAFLDEGVVATLEADAARVAAELTEVTADAGELGPLAAELGSAEAALAAQRAEFEAMWSAEEPTPTGQAAELRGERAARSNALIAAEREAATISTRLERLQSMVAVHQTEVGRLREEVAAAADAEEPLVEAVDAAEQAALGARDELDKAGDSLSAAEGDLARWSARADALAMSLDEARARAGTAALEDVDGVLGTLLDLVDVDDEHAAAFEAAADAALRAVVVADASVARRALERLLDGDLDGAVLVADRSAGSSKSLAGGTPLRPCIRAVDARIDPLLDALFGSVTIAEDWRSAADLALAHPAAVIVTRRGDRFGPGGWRIGAGAIGVTRVALEEAERRRNEAAISVDVARTAREVARAATDVVQQEAAQASAALDTNDARLQAASDALQRALRDLASAAADAEDLTRHLAELNERIELDRQYLVELDAALAHQTAAEQRLQAQVRERRVAAADLEERSRAVGALRSDLEVRAASVDQRRTYLTRRQAELDQRLAAYEAERGQAEQRRAGSERAEAAVARLTEIVSGHLATIDGHLELIRARRRQHNEATRAVAERLDALRRDRQAAERSLEVVREQQRRAEIEEAEARIKLESLIESLRTELDIEPAVAIAAPEPEVEGGVSARQRARDLERDVRLMGPINPLALEEFDALTERHQFLDEQLEDVKTTRRDLAKVIRKIDEEIVTVFRGAFVDVAENFERLFATLFPGGKGRLLLTDADDLLNTGVEIEAKPAGKNVKHLSLLSGGERSLTAMAYLFAIFRSRPSPFYVLDEVEAALDDINLHRFLDLVAEFRKEAQLLIVSHQKRTMEAADCLYGVSMRPGGSSKVVSERLSRTA